MIIAYKTANLWEAAALRREGAVFQGIEPDVGRSNSYLFVFQNDHSLANAIKHFSSDRWPKEKHLLKNVSELKKVLANYKSECS